MGSVNRIEDKWLMPEPIAFADFASIRWRDRCIVCALDRTGRVLSTSRSHGGVREDIAAAVNHQICEPGQCATDRVREAELDGYIDRLAAQMGCDPARTVTMLTAAAMKHAAWARDEFEGVQALSLVTAGVVENAACAGDPATYYETANGWASTQGPMPTGTINALVLISHPLTPGGLVKAGITLTEAKASVLHELQVRSLYSPTIATGTGTDQYVIACPQTGPFVLREAQAHTKLGEMIARTLAEALRESLRLQNGLDHAAQSRVSRLLRRFGQSIPPDDWDTDPQSVAAAAALAGVLDHLRWRLLPATSRNDLLARHAGLLAATIAGDPRHATRMEGELLQQWGACQPPEEAEIIALALRLGLKGRQESPEG